VGTKFDIYVYIPIAWYILFSVVLGVYMDRSNRHVIYLVTVLLNKDTTLFFNLGILFDIVINSLKIPKGQSEAVNQTTDYTMAKIK
jgi:hypothetical protein